jgi:hypothetical protein
MHVVVNVALVIGFMALLIIGFLSVAHDLLSRIVCKSRSYSNEARSEQIDPERGHPQAERLKDCKRRIGPPTSSRWMLAL